MSTYKNKFNKKFGQDKDESNSKSKISKLSGIPKSILDDVYDRGIGAYKTNPQSVRMKGTFKKNVKAPLSQKLSKEQWAISRVYAFVMKTLNPKEPQNQDKDLIKKSRDILKKKK